MKKIVSILVIGLFVLTEIGAIAVPIEHNPKNIIEVLNISTPLLNEKQDYVQVTLPESDLNLIVPGKPLLPKITKVYAFPFGTKITDVRVTFSEETQETISKLVEPSPEAVIVSSVNGLNTDDEKSVTYDDIETYPETRYAFRTGAGLQDAEHVLFLTVNIYPLQYTPSTNTITYSKTATINIDYVTPVNPVTFGDEYSLLILTPSQFTDELQPLVDYKNNDGTSTLMVTLDEIPDTGVDKQESIKYYIKDAIENWGITYLLLVGAGIEENQLFPVRYAWIPSGEYEQNFPSDLYYADIYNSTGGFSTWDKDGNGKHAEMRGSFNDMDKVDMYPDVYLGKLPCNNEAEVTTIVDKIINYEEHNKMLNTIVQIGGDTFPGDDDNVNEGEYANSKVIEKLPGYTSKKIWASESDGALQLTKENIAAGFNGNTDFVDFSGHGSHLSWATHAPADEETWLPPKSIISPYTGWLYIDYDFYLVHNQYKHPVVVFNACSCSKYTESATCIAWKTMNGNAGGIASFGASGIGYGSYGLSEVERVWGWMEVHIFEGVYTDKILGVAWAHALNGYINSFIEDEYWDDADYKTILEMTMFGDPSLAIENGKDPKTFSVQDTIQSLPLLNRILYKLPQLEILVKFFTKIKAI